MLNRFTKIGWLFTITFAILSYGCATSPQDAGGDEAISSSKGKPAKYAYAIELIKRKEYGKAQDILLSLEPNYQDADLYTNIAIIYLNKKSYDKAKIYIEKSVGLDANNYISQNIYGVVLRNLGNFDGAIQAYNTSIAKNSAYAESYLNLAILYDVFIDSPVKALPYYEKYKELASNDSNIDKWIIEVKRRIK